MSDGVAPMPKVDVMATHVYSMCFFVPFLGACGGFSPPHEDPSTTAQRPSATQPVYVAAVDAESSSGDAAVVALFEDLRDAGPGEYGDRDGGGGLELTWE